MNNTNLPPFYIGQRVVCLKSKTNAYGHSCTKGSIYTVHGLNICRCGSWKIDIGVKDKRPWTKMQCGKCSGLYERNGYAIWAEASYFAPVEHNFQPIPLSKVIEIETELINAN